MKANFTKTIVASLGFFSLMSFSFAGAIVIGPVQNIIISADFASNASESAFTRLDDIIITEKKATDFAATAGAPKSLILTAPAGWSFKPGCGTIGAMNAKDFNLVSMHVTANAIIINFTVTATSNMDALNITGIQVQANNGANIDCQGMIYRSPENPGTATLKGIENGTVFANLSQASGTAAKLAFATSPVATLAGTVFEQQPMIITQDQFGNPTSKGLNAIQNVKIKLSAGSGELEGTKMLNIGSLGGNGLVQFNDLQLTTAGIKKLMVTAGSLSFAVTNEMVIKEQPIDSKISSGDAEDYYSDWMCFSTIPKPATAV